MARELTTVERGLESRAIARALHVGAIVSSRDYGDIKAAAFEDARELVDGWRNDTSLAERIAQHVDVNSLAQAINYHALIHAGVVMPRDEDDPEDTTDPDVCPVCGSRLR